MKSWFEIDGLAPHLLDLVHGDEAAVERRIEEAQALGALGHLLERRGAREDEHFLRDLRGGDPDLGAAEDVAVAAPLRARLDRRGVETGIGLGDGKARLLAPGHERRQHARLLRLGAEGDDGTEAEDVHVHGGGPGHAGAGGGDRLHHDRGLGDPKARAAIGRRHTDTEPAVGGKRLMQLDGKAAVAVAREPIIVTEAGTDAGDGVAHRLLLGGGREIHQAACWPGCTAPQARQVRCATLA